MYCNSNNFLMQDIEGAMVQTRGGSSDSRNADKQDHLVIEVVQDDRSVLYMRDQHCSDDI